MKSLKRKIANYKNQKRIKRNTELMIEAVSPWLPDSLENGYSIFWGAVAGLFFMFGILCIP